MTRNKLVLLQDEFPLFVEVMTAIWNEAGYQDFAGIEQATRFFISAYDSVHTRLFEQELRSLLEDRRLSEITTGKSALHYAGEWGGVKITEDNIRLMHDVAKKASGSVSRPRP